MVWLMLRDDEPNPAQLALLGAALVAAVDHGPQAPSISIARMAVTCGVPLNTAMASAINVLDGVHSGADEQRLQLYDDMLACAASQPLERALDAALEAFVSAHGKMIPGFGHRFPPVDPHAVRLLALVDEAVRQRVVDGRHAQVGRLLERTLERRAGQPIPMNIDGTTAVVYGELGFAPALARSLFILSRSASILAHAWEQKNQGGRIKGPLPPSIGYTYAERAKPPITTDFVVSDTFPNLHL